MVVLAALDVLGFRLGVVRIADELVLEELLGTAEELVLETLPGRDEELAEELVLEVVALALTDDEVEAPDDEVARTVLKTRVEVG